MQASVIVINYGTPDLIRSFTQSARRSVNSDLIAEVIIVDNGFPEKGDSRTIIDPSQYPFDVFFIQNPKTSYSSGINLGASSARAKSLIISNSDIEWIRSHSIKPLLEYLWGQVDIGITGPQLLYPDLSWQMSHGRFPSIRSALFILFMMDTIAHATCSWKIRKGLSLKRRTVDYIVGAFMAIRRECFDAVGGFDESFQFYAEDSDFCYRARSAGWKSVFVPEAQVIHLRGATSGQQIQAESEKRFIQAQFQFVEKHYGASEKLRFRKIFRFALKQKYLLYKGISLFLRSSKIKYYYKKIKSRYYATLELND